MSKLLGNYFSKWFRIFDFKGRSSRSEFWYAMLGTIIVYVLSCVIIGFCAGIFEGVTNLETSGFTNIVVSVCVGIMFVSTAALCIRRLHDIGMTGWLYLLIFTGIGYIVLLVLACIPGKVEANKWGVNPKN